MSKKTKQTAICRAMVRQARLVSTGQAEILISDETGTLKCEANRSGTIQILNGEIVCVDFYY
jgi:hypothetical protein